jgi:hypothetical protein
VNPVKSYTLLCFVLSALIGIHCTPKIIPPAFPIVALYGPTYSAAHSSAWIQVARAGFNLNYSPFESRDSNLHALNCADSAGIRLILSDARLDSSMLLPTYTMSNLDSLIKDYSTHPGFFGFYLKNDPTADDFDRLSVVTNYLREKKPSLSVYINLLPPFAALSELKASSFQSYLEKYLDKVMPSVLSIPLFPFENSGLNSDYYENLEYIRQTSSQYHIPFWPVILSVPSEGTPVLKHSHLRLQIFSSIAYGAKGIQYFAYQAPMTNSTNYKDALVTVSGEETKLYNDASTINSEVQKLNSVLFESRSTGVFHSAPVPSGCSPLPANCPVTKIEGSKILISLFSDRKNTKYVLIVNTNYHYGTRPRIYFSEKIKKLVEIPKNDCSPLIIEWNASVTDKSYPILLKAGDGRLFKIIG